MTIETAQRTHRILRPLNLAPTPVSRPFKVGKTFLNKNGQVKIAGWGSNFETWFAGKEEARPSVPLSVYVIEPKDGTIYAYDQDIVADLGGEEAAEIALADFWDQIALQGHGQAGQLHMDGLANIGYAKDAKGVLRAVNARWLGDGWHFYAYEFPRPRGWHAGYHVLAPRNS